MPKITLVNPGKTDLTKKGDNMENVELLNPFSSRQMKKAWNEFRRYGGRSPMYDRSLWSRAVEESMDNPFRGDAIRSVWRTFKRMGGTTPAKDRTLWRRAFDVVEREMPINRPWRPGEWYESRGLRPRAAMFPPVTGFAGAYGNPGIGGMVGEGYEKYLLGMSLRDLGGVLGGVAFTHLVPPAIGRAIKKENLTEGTIGVLVQVLVAILAGHAVMRLTGESRDAQMVMIGGIASAILAGLAELQGKELTLPSISGDELLMLEDEDALLGTEELLGGELDVTEDEDEEVLIL